MTGILTSSQDVMVPEQAGILDLMARMAEQPPRCHKLELTITRDKDMQALKWLIVDEAKRLGLQCILFPDLEANTTLMIVLPAGSP